MSYLTLSDLSITELSPMFSPKICCCVTFYNISSLSDFVDL